MADTAGRLLTASVTSETIRVGPAIAAAWRPDGMNLITSAGAVASQTELHLHLHVVPQLYGMILTGKRVEAEDATCRVF